MRFGPRGPVSFSWFDTHRTDAAGIAMLVAVVLLIVLFVKIARDQ